MKKLLNFALGYALAAMAAGVFYREFTKFNGFDGVTALGKVHTHLFLLGMVVFLLAALFARATPSLTRQKRFGGFLIVYNLGVPLTSLMLLVRGTVQVLGTELSKGADAAISGFAGIGHILTGVGLLLFLLCLRRATDTRLQ